MAKIPFILEAWLADKSQKVETRSGKNVRIICWDKIGVPIVALVGDADDIVTYNRDGTTGQQMHLPSDLFIITPEPELTEFESVLFSAFSDAWQQYLLGEEVNVKQWVREHSTELLDLARKELETDNIIVSKIVYLDDIFEKGKEVGKEEALKDLPKWSPNDIYPELNDVVVGSIGTDNHFLIHRGSIIHLESLEKLPGFKED